MDAGIYASIGISASALAGAAARSAINGTSFGDNVIAALPAAIGSTLGSLFAGSITQGAKVVRSDAASPSGQSANGTAFTVNSPLKELHDQQTATALGKTAVVSFENVKVFSLDGGKPVTIQIGALSDGSSDAIALELSQLSTKELQFAKTRNIKFVAVGDAVTEYVPELKGVAVRGHVYTNGLSNVSWYTVGGT